MMTADAFSDLVLLTVCVVAAWRCGWQRPGLAAALLAIAVAAACGVARFNGIEAAVGPHDFFSLLATVAAVPLLALSLYWPTGLLARHPRAAALWLIFAGAFGLLLVSALHWQWVAQAVPAMALLLLMVAVWRQPSIARGAGLLLLLAGFVIQATQWSYGAFTASQGLHYLMAAGLPLLVLPWRQTATMQ